MAVTTTNLPFPSQGFADQKPVHSELEWLPIITLPIFGLAILFFTGAARLYAWVRYDVPLVDDSTSSPSSVSTRHSRREARDLPHLNSIAPPKTSQALRSELSHEQHASWAVPVPNMTCVICFDVVRDTDVIRHLACEHTFHADCIATWYFAEHNTCPICAYNFLSPGSMPQRPRSAHI